MSWDVDDLLDELGETIASTLRELDAQRVIRRESLADHGVIKVTTRVSIGTLVPDKPYPEPKVLEPLVDVFDDGKGLRVIIELPGIRKEDVHVRFLDGLLRIEVSQEGRVHQKDVPCNVPPGNVAVWSTKENNSVVEITFAGTQRSHPR